MALVRLLSPVPQRDVQARPVPPRLGSLAGRTVGFRYEWVNFELFVDRIVERLAESGEVGDIKRWDLVKEKRPSSPRDAGGRKREFEEFAEGLDAAVVGIAA